MSLYIALTGCKLYKTDSLLSIATRRLNAGELVACLHSVAQMLLVITMCGEIGWIYAPNMEAV